MNIQGIDVSQATQPVEEQDQNYPDAARLVAALRQIGYSLEQAIADLVDNAINAGAASVLIRFLHDGERIKSVVVVDDGGGMSPAQLKQAMKFGSLPSSNSQSLGKFGMGLKLASLSYAESLDVYSRRNGRSAGRRWTLENIDRGWWCERLGSPVPAQILSAKWAGLDLRDSGTVIIWNKVDKLPTHRSGLRATLRAIEGKLRLHLGLTFHRFLERGELNLFLDQNLVDRSDEGIATRINALNPFQYVKPGSLQFPKVFQFDLSGVGRLYARAHIWPPNCISEEYRLGRRTSSRQGFYFYRNDRLIQAGGWNGFVQDDAEPHSSLARVEIDLPPELDGLFGINVQKSAVIAPPGFAESLHLARSKDGSSFEEFRREAQRVYRSANPRANGVIAVPSEGVSRNIAELYTSQLNGHKKPVAEVAFRWTDLPTDELFRIDIRKFELHLNSSYRSTISGSEARSESDSPLFKMLLFQLAKRHFESSRCPTDSAKGAKEIKELNALLLAAAIDGSSG